MYNKKKKKEFSKVLLLQESLLIWLITLSCIVMAFMCIMRSSFVELPWITALVGVPWGAYGASQAFYYKKSEKENTKDGITYLKAQKAFLPDDDNAVG